MIKMSRPLVSFSSSGEDGDSSSKEDEDELGPPCCSEVVCIKRRGCGGTVSSQILGVTTGLAAGGQGLEPPVRPQCTHNTSYETVEIQKSAISAAPGFNTAVNRVASKSRSLSADTLAGLPVHSRLAAGANGVLTVGPTVPACPVAAVGRRLGMYPEPVTSS